ncbi:TPA: hypothetical protein ACSP7Z_005150, partial [Serratia fonticola]
MFYPGGKLDKYLQSESIGFWIDYSYKEKSIELFSKMPLSTIKGIALGARLEFHFSYIEAGSRHLVLGMTVYDITDNPTIYAYAIRDKVEVRGLGKMLKGKYNKINLTIYDDFNHPAIWGSIKFSEKTLADVRAENANVFSTVKSFSISNEVTDVFYAGLIPRHESNENYTCKTITQEVSFDKINNIMSIVPNANTATLKYILSEGEKGSEGYVQEDMVVYILSHIFGGDILHSPLHMDGEKKRELTDVIINDGNNVLIVESKGGGIIEKGKILDNFRRKSGITKEITKAIRQIEGVSKRCLKGVEIINEAGVVIGKVNKENNKHVLIVVT